MTIVVPAPNTHIYGNGVGVGVGTGGGVGVGIGSKNFVVTVISFWFSSNSKGWIISLKGFFGRTFSTFWLRSTSTSKNTACLLPNVLLTASFIFKKALAGVLLISFDPKFLIIAIFLFKSLLLELSIVIFLLILESDLTIFFK